MPSTPGAPRRPYRRETVDKRRDALVAAALDLVAEGGKDAATVRAIASRAGVTPGLIRHYFATKEALLRESYRRLMEDMLQEGLERIDASSDGPAGRLATFVAASLSPPVVDMTRLGLWTAFIHDLRRDPAMRETHIQAYLGYRDQLQLLIAELPGRRDPAQDRADAIACNGVIDGLWMEASAVPELFAPGEIARIGLAAVGRILGVDLAVRLALPFAEPEPAP